MSEINEYEETKESTIFSASPQEVANTMTGDFKQGIETTMVGGFGHGAVGGFERGSVAAWDEKSYFDELQKRRQSVEEEEKNLNKLISDMYTELMKNSKDSKRIYGQIKELKVQLKNLEEEKKLIKESLENVE